MAGPVLARYPMAVPSILQLGCDSVELRDYLEVVVVSVIVGHVEADIRSGISRVSG